MKPVVFFDLGQTLVSEWDFIDYFDRRFLEILNGYGARIDLRSYKAVRDSMIRDRKIGYGSVLELVMAVCKSVLPTGYEEPIVRTVESEIKEKRKSLFLFSKDAEPVLRGLSRKYDLGIIANQSKDIVELLQSSGLNKFFKVNAISDIVGLKKPDPQIFMFAIDATGSRANECLMVGDRLDTDICPAKKIGMKTIRVTDSLFALQEATEECEKPDITVATLAQVPTAVEKLLDHL